MVVDPPTDLMLAPENDSRRLGNGWGGAEDRRAKGTCLQIKSNDALLVAAHDAHHSSISHSFLWLLYHAADSQREVDRGIRGRVPHLRAGRRSLRPFSEYVFVRSGRRQADHRWLR